MKFLSSFILILILCGCAGRGVPLNQVSGAIENSSTSNLDGQHQYRLDYFIHDKKYSYATFEVENKHRYFQLLVEEGKIVAASEINRDNLYRPTIRRCTLFPHHEDMDIQHCLSEFNSNVLQANNRNFLQDLSVLNSNEKNNKSDESVAAITFATLLSPLLVPAALMQSPILVYDYTSTEGRKKEFQLALGDNESLGEYLASLDPQHVSKFGDSGTAYLESGILNEPALAFGFIGNKLVWIQEDPSWVCGGGFMFWGLKCTVGEHDDDHF